MTRILLAALSVLFSLLLPAAGNAKSDVRPEIVPFAPHGDQIGDLRLSIDGHLLATRGWDRTLKIWEVQTGRLLRTIDLSKLQITDIAVSPTIQRAVALHENGDVKLWDLDSATVEKTLAAKLQHVSNVVVADAHHVIVVLEDNTLLSWNIDTGKRTTLQSASGEPNSIDLVEPLPDNRTILVADNKGTVVHWDIVSGRELRRYKVHHEHIVDLAIMPGGQSFVSRGGRAVKFWNIKTGRLERTLEGIEFGRGGMEVDLSGQRLLVHLEPSEKHDGVLEIRDISSGQL